MIECIICDEYFTDIDKHIQEKHNRGITVCPSCKKSFRLVAVATKNGKPKLTSCMYCGAELYPKEKPTKINHMEALKKHFQKYNTKDIYGALRLEKIEEEDPFWITAKDVLSKKEYKELRLYVYRYGQDIYGYREFARHTECKRFSQVT